MRALRTLALRLPVRRSPRVALPARAQVDKPVRLLVGFAPGGSADIAARLLADRMKDDLQAAGRGREPARAPAAGSSPRR